MKNFQYLDTIESKIEEIFDLLSDNDEFKFDVVIDILSNLTQTVSQLDSLAYETDEWSCFAHANEYKEQLLCLYRTLLDKLEENKQDELDEY